MDGTVSPAVTGALPGPPAAPISLHSEGIRSQPSVFPLPYSRRQAAPVCRARRKCVDSGGGDFGAPDRIRTCDLWLRRPTLYPTELRALEQCMPGSRRADSGGIASERRSALIRHRHRLMPAGTVAASSLRPDPPPCARKRAIRFDDGTLDDSGAGGQGALHSPGYFARTSTDAGELHRRRTAPPAIRTTHLSRTAGICNHIRVVRNDPGGSREQG